MVITGVCLVSQFFRENRYQLLIISIISKSKFFVKNRHFDISSECLLRT